MKRDIQKLIEKKMISMYGTFGMCQKRYEEFDFENRGIVMDLMVIQDYISPVNESQFIDYVIENDKIALFNAAVMYLMDMRSGRVFRGQVPILSYIGKDYNS